MSRFLFFILSLLYLAGLWISDRLILEHVDLKLGNTEDQGLCNLVDFFSCKAAAQSSYSEFLGMPIAALGEAYYITALLTLLALRFTSKSQKDEVHSTSTPSTSVNFSLSTLGLASIFSVIYSLFLGSISLFQLQQLCPLCVGLYLINFLIFGCFLFQFKAHIKAWIPRFKTATPWLILVLMGSSTIATQSGYAIRYNHRLKIQQRKRAKKAPPKHYTLKVGKAPLRTSSSTLETPETLVVEFSDFECPFCKRFSKSLKTLFDDPEIKMNYAFKHFPLSSKCNRFTKRDMHPQACEAARVAVCAEKQGKFWEMHDLLFENNKKLLTSDLLRYAQDLQLNLDEFKTCLDDPKTKKRIENDIEEAHRLKVRSTPSFYVDGWKFSGAYSAKRLKTTLKNYAHRPASAGPSGKRPAWTG